jgi:hypothetical protein
MENTLEINSEKTFEEEIYEIMEKHLNQGKLSNNDIKMCRDICLQYEMRVKAFKLTQKLMTMCQNNNCEDFNNENKKIVITLYESFSGGKEKCDKINANFYDPSFTVFMTYENSEEYGYNGKQKNLFDKFSIDGHLILKKENGNGNMKKSFINLSYLKEIIDTNNLKISVNLFLKLFLSLFNVFHIFENMISNIEKNPNEYLFDKNWTSDSDISSIDSNEEE